MEENKPQAPVDHNARHRSRYVLLIIMSLIFQFGIGFIFSGKDAQNTLTIVRFTLLIVTVVSISQLLILHYKVGLNIKLAAYSLILLAISGAIYLYSNFTIGISLLVAGGIGYTLMWMRIHVKSNYE